MSESILFRYFKTNIGQIVSITDLKNDLLANSFQAISKIKFDTRKKHVAYTYLGNSIKNYIIEYFRRVNLNRRLEQIGDNHDRPVDEKELPDYDLAISILQEKKELVKTEYRTHAKIAIQLFDIIIDEIKKQDENTSIKYLSYLAIELLKHNKINSYYQFFRDYHFAGIIKYNTSDPNYLRNKIKKYLLKNNLEFNEQNAKLALIEKKYKDSRFHIYGKSKNKRYNNKENQNKNVVSDIHQ